MLSYLLNNGGKPVSHHADKRTVATDALETLGTIIGPDERRDAIHLAVLPVVAARWLSPGDHVGFLEDGRVGPCGKPVGIVDPFIRGFILTGQRFWLVIYPRQITSLRHIWTHPDIPDAEASVPAVLASTGDQKAASEAWLRDFIARSDCPDYDTVMNAATGQHHLNEIPGEYHSSSNDGEHLFFVGRDAHGEIPPEFWEHISILAGKEIPEDERAEWFSCSC